MLLPLLAVLALQQAGAAQPGIKWRPVVPRQGSLIVVSAPDAVTGWLAGEPLHFVSGQALAAVPLGADDGIGLEVFTLQDEVFEAIRVSLPVATRAAARERIRVDARFTAPPDSALQVRIARERELSRGAAARAHLVPRLWQEPFLRPRPAAARVTSPFGGGRRVNGVWRSRHYGLDLDGRTGDPVYASNRGIVALVGDFFYGGRSVYVHHGLGLMTVYHHLSRPLVAAGDTVGRGQVIGLVGATGRVTGPHLHWAAQYGSVAFDPSDLLTMTFPPPAASPD
jgi:murein DD-endopeptidase MepM/ murein hydrolase activator NlpD